MTSRQITVDNIKQIMALVESGLAGAGMQAREDALREIGKKARLWERDLSCLDESQSGNGLVVFEWVPANMMTRCRKCDAEMVVCPDDHPNFALTQRGTSESIVLKICPNGCLD